jgi:hypothetical protein
MNETIDQIVIPEVLLNISKLYYINQRRAYQRIEPFPEWHVRLSGVISAEPC